MKKAIKKLEIILWIAVIAMIGLKWLFGIQSFAYLRWRGFAIRAAAIV
jgi:hypothetical protein